MSNLQNENAFVQLCRLASEERWCWRFPCTTCGNGEFRYAFRELSKGNGPSDASWMIHKHACGLPNQLGPIPSPKDVPDSERVAVLEVCADAELAHIADQCVFPDWLGYLGLVVRFMRCGDNTYNKTMARWAGQLRDMVSEGDAIWETLDRAAKSSSRPLSFGDLEDVEFAMLRDGQDTQS